MGSKSGDTLKRLRGNRDRAAVAEAVGITERALQSYELGERIPRDDVKQRLADYYHRSVQYIFF